MQSRRGLVETYHYTRWKTEWIIMGGTPVRGRIRAKKRRGNRARLMVRGEDSEGRARIESILLLTSD
jgi:hypothetical protein